MPRTSNPPSPPRNEWAAVRASLQDAERNPPAHLDGDLAKVYDWPDEPLAGAMLVSDPLGVTKDGGTTPTTEVVLLLDVGESGRVTGVCLNSDASTVASHVVPVGLEDVPLRRGGAARADVVVGVYPTADGRDDSPRGSMEGLSHVVGSNNVLQKVLWGQVDKDGLRLYAGLYTWEKGRLEAELKDDRWVMIMATKHFVFSVPPTSLYYRLMDKLGYT